MKKTSRMVLAVIAAVYMVGGLAVAAPPANNNANASGKQGEAAVTEGQYARLLVQVLGLQRFLPANPTPQEYFSILMQNGIAPREGWNASSPVSKAELARTIVQALGLSGEIAQPNNDQAWIDKLQGLGFDFSTVGAALRQLNASGNPVGNGVSPSTDPNEKSPNLPLNDSQFGADMSTVRQLLAFLETQMPNNPPFRPTPPRDGKDPTPRG